MSATAPLSASDTKHRSYPSYRCASAEWLGELPDHWSVIRSKYLLAEVDERSDSGDELLLSLTKSRGLIPRSEITDRPAGAATLVGYKVCRPGDIVMNKMQAWNGMFGFSRYHGIVSPDYAVFRPTRELDARYFGWLFTISLYVSQFLWRSRGMGTAFLRLHPSVFGDVETLRVALHHLPLCIPIPLALTRHGNSFPTAPSISIRRC